MARGLIAQAAFPCECGHCERIVDDPVAVLAEHAPSEWARTVDRVLFSDLENAVGYLWQRGWQPDEFVRMVRREAGKKAAALGAGMVLAENRRHVQDRVVDEWARQIRGLGRPWWGTDADHASVFAERHRLDRRDCIELYVRVLALVETLPELHLLLPLPGTVQAVSAAAASQADPAMLARIRALLAKAEATEFPEEAEALTDRAQQMMARHSVDHAALAADTGTTPHVNGRRLPVEAPTSSRRQSC